MEIAKGDALLVPTSDGGKHLYFILNDPHKDPPHYVLLVNATTYNDKPHEDSSCFLYKGDHPFIQHKSYIAYSFCKQVTKDSIERNIDNGLYTVHERASGEVMQAIIDGLHESPRAKPFIKKFLDSLP